MNIDHPLSQQEFNDIYSKVPRLTVEIILVDQKGILLTLRDIEPCKGKWHLPGGTVRFGEKLEEAVRRIAHRELTITVTDMKLLGYIEYPSHYENGLDSPVGIAFQVTDFTGAIKHNAEAKDFGYFQKLPVNMHLEQQVFIGAHHLL